MRGKLGAPAAADTALETPVPCLGQEISGLRREQTAVSGPRLRCVASGSPCAGPIQSQWVEGRSLLQHNSGKLTYIAPQAARFFGCSVEELHADRFIELIHDDDRERLMKHMGVAMQGHTNDGDSIDYRMITGDRRLINVRTTLCAVTTDSLLRGITIDVTKQTKLEFELRQAQKLESVGKLAAGIAHEINTPVQFVSDSLHFAKTGIDDLLQLVGACQRTQRNVLEGAPAVEQAEEAAKRSTRKSSRWSRACPPSSTK